MSKLFTPLKLGALELSQRVVMAPLTRMRAGPNEVPNKLNAEYYAQRATPGQLIISEATQISQQAQGYPATPGIFTEEQAAGWRLVTDAVHGKGGLILAQIWHTGRVSNSSYGQQAISASAIAINGKSFTKSFESAPHETPRAATEEDIARVLEEYRTAARTAKSAGFDGVEIHAANGYLIEQFLKTSTNQREDGYGGSVDNRVRLLREVVQAVLEVWPAERVGIRLSPWGTFGDISDENPVETYTAVLKFLEPLKLAYTHIVEARVDGSGDKDEAFKPELIPALVKGAGYTGAVIAAGGYKRDDALEAVDTGRADAVAIGRFFISNPDLPLRWKENVEVTPYDRATFYGGDEKGYTDYPFYKKSD